MKSRPWTWMTLLALALLTLGAPAAQEISVTVDGRPLGFDQPPVMREGRILVPLRGIFEALGAEVEWDAAARTVRARSGESSVALPLGSRTATVDGRPVTLDAPAATVAGRTMVPLRFVAEALGAEVRWEGAARQVTILSKAGSALPGPVVTPAPEPEPPQAPPPGAGAAPFQASLDLPRIQVGNQAGFLKLLDRTRQKVDYFRTLDDRSTAPVTAWQRTEIYGRMGIPPDRVAQVARQVMAGYPTLPKMAALALLGVLGSDSPSALGADLAASLQSFAVERMRSEKDNVLRRQALLALALMSSASARTTQAVLEFFETDDNLWTTFPVQMFFQYHAAEIQALPGLQEIRSRVAAVPSLYSASILEYLAPQERPSGRRLLVTSPLVRDLAGQGLSAMPQELAQASNLRQLSLAGNRLADLPEGLGGLQDLRCLDLSGNRFSAFPAALLGLGNLRELDLSGNALQELPTDLARLASLEVLCLRGNRLARLPSDLGGLSRLSVLELEGNPLPPAEVERVRRALPGTHVLY